MKKQLPLRQRIRKAVIILAFLTFPITINYLSPYLIVQSAAEGIANGSLIMFGLLFLSAPFLNVILTCPLDILSLAGRGMRRGSQ